MSERKPTATCEGCGAPIYANRGGRYCMANKACRRLADSKDIRGSRPKPIEQAAGLPPLGVIAYSDDGERVQCHECGKWYRSLGKHVVLGHGYALPDYLERYELARTASLDSPSVQAANRLRALNQGIGEIGRANLATLPHPGLPKGTRTRLSVRIARSESQRSR